LCKTDSFSLIISTVPSSFYTSLWKWRQRVPCLAETFLHQSRWASALTARQLLRAIQGLVIHSFQMYGPGVSAWACFQALWNNGQCGTLVQSLQWPGSSQHSTNSFVSTAPSSCSNHICITRSERRILNFGLSVVLFLGTPISRSYILSPTWWVCLFIWRTRLLSGDGDRQSRIQSSFASPCHCGCLDLGFHQ
jgi:hypothetical protein